MPAWHPYEDYRQTYAARSELGGGVLLTQIHDMDYLGWLIGWPDQVFFARRAPEQSRNRRRGYREHLDEMWCAGAPYPGAPAPGLPAKASSRRCDILLEGGKACFDLLNGSLEVFDAGGASVVREDTATFRRNDMFLSEMRHFLACLEGRRNRAFRLRRAARGLAVALAARKSLLSGHVEAVEYLQTEESRDKLPES